MTVKKLKKLLAEVDDKIEVFIYQPSHIGGFLFAPACEHDSGLTTFAPPEDGEIGKERKAFCIFPHGVIDDDGNDEQKEIPEMN